MANLLNGGEIMKKHTKKASDIFDWPRADAMTDEQIHAAALADPDPDAQPRPRGAGPANEAGAAVSRRG